MLNTNAIARNATANVTRCRCWFYGISFFYSINIKLRAESVDAAVAAADDLAAVSICINWYGHKWLGVSVSLSFG